MDSFLDYLAHIRVKVALLNDSPLEEEELKEMFKSLKDVLVTKVGETLHESLKSIIKKEDLEKRLVLIDRQDHPECRENLLHATGTIARPARWKQVIELLRLAQGNDVR